MTMHYIQTRKENQLRLIQEMENSIQKIIKFTLIYIQKNKKTLNLGFYLNVGAPEGT